MDPSQFDKQPHLTGAKLLLSPLRKADYEGLYAAASDPLVWAGHPVKQRYLEEVFRPYFDTLLASGETLAVRVRSSNKIIGCSRYYVAPGIDQDIAIGYTFLRRDHWGGATNRELKTLMFDHAFESFENVWLHIDPDNIRSQKAAQKLGARFGHEEVQDLGTGEKRTFCYRLARADWRSLASSN